MVEPYSYVRFRWWNSVDLDEIVKEFPGFKTKKILVEKPDDGVSILRDSRNEIAVEADTLRAFISPLRAILNQKEAKPFTKRDLELREKVMELFPHDRSTPFPWMFSSEPKFEKEKP
jgi:hypothetical protein